MVAAKVGSWPVEPLAIVGAAKLASPDHEGLIKHAPVSKVLHQGRRRLVGLLALPLEPALEPAVMVPALMIELDEPHTPLGQPPGQQTVGGKAAGILGIGTVTIEDMLGFVGKIGRLRDTRLHPVGHFIVGNAGSDLRIRRAGKLMLVQLP